MESRYKVILAGRNLYREIGLTQETDTLRAGTKAGCEVRFRTSDFFSDWSIEFVRDREQWNVICSGELYISDGVRKLFSVVLKNGDELSIRYQETGAEAFRLLFAMDFEYAGRTYDSRISLENRKSLRIGSSQDCDIVISDEYVKNDCFEIRRTGSGWTLLPGITGFELLLNGNRAADGAILEENDFISLADFGFCFRRGFLYVASGTPVGWKNVKPEEVPESRSSYRYPKFNRSTRVRRILSGEEIKVLDPPAAPAKPSENIALQLLPMVLTLAVTVLLRGFLMNSGGTMGSFVILSAVTMSIGIMTSVLSIIDGKKKFKKGTEERTANYSRYAEGKRKEISAERDRETHILEKIYYDIRRDTAIADGFLPELFERQGTDEDFLAVRLGTGKVPSLRTISYKPMESYDGGDELTQIPGKISEEFRDLKNAPVTVCLREHNSIGFVGSISNLSGMLKNVTVDLSVRQYYEDVKLFFIAGDAYAEDFRWVRFLPHIRNDVLGIRNLACDDQGRGMLFEYLYKELSGRQSAKKNYPWLVVFVFGDMEIKRHPVSRFLPFSAALGVTFLFFEETAEALPSACSAIIETGEKTGKIIRTADGENITAFSYEAVGDAAAERVVRRLAPVYCEKVSLESQLTKNITLFQLMGICAPEDLDLGISWSASRIDKSMAAPLGVRVKNEVVYLDLHEKKHGPHGLVAGTTGSGKSEVLQTYILSMASLFHPYEVGFVIIDFKGGGMVNQFQDLPHLIGAITNIDGREIDRSLMSIRAELKKRQMLFARYGVNHIDAYIRLFKKGEAETPLPHLILIVDEFAELKMDQPEFMKELISAARIGRSLGVHLILATQKPSGVVDAQIWSNSNFRLCLKVQTKDDSNEVLKTPLAAEIREPGRAYLQVGNNEIFELFQSAYSGAPAEITTGRNQREFSLSRLDLSGRRSVIYEQKKEKASTGSETQLTAIVRYIRKYTEEHGIPRLPGICLPPLAEKIPFVSAENAGDGIHTKISLGIYDDPDHQLQDIVSLDLLEGNVLIVGSTQFGKTGVLQTVLRGLAEQYSPEDVNVYILDFASTALRVFEDLNHVGGTVIPGQDERIKNFIRMIRDEIKKRKEVFSAMGITSFASCREAGCRDFAHIIAVIDNFTSLREFYPEYDEELLGICREGVSVGITLVATSQQTNSIGFKFINCFATKIALYCNQSDEYGMLFDHCRMQPRKTPGRGLIMLQKTIFEFQAYQAFEGVREIERVAKIRDFAAETNRKYGSVFAPAIPEVPQILDSAYVERNFDRKKFKEWEIPVGIDYETVQFLTVDTARTATIGIISEEAAGRLNFVRVLLQNYDGRSGERALLYVLDDYAKELGDLESDSRMMFYSADKNEFGTMLSEVESELELRRQTAETDGIAAVKKEPQILCIVNSGSVYADTPVNSSAAESYKKIIKAGPEMKVLVVFADTVNAPAGYTSPEMHRLAKDYDQKYLLDDLSGLKLVDPGVLALRQFKKPLEQGEGYRITEKGIQKFKVIDAGTGKTDAGTGGGR